MTDAPETYPNPDMVVGPDLREAWSTAAGRRRGFHNLHRLSRYGMYLRSRDVLQLGHCLDRRIGDLTAVRNLTDTTMFSAMVALRGDVVVFEKYASDFSTGCPHPVMSISKTTIHLFVGKLVDEGKIDLTAQIGAYLPEIGSGYRDATVQDVLDMNIVNDYGEDYSDPLSTALVHGAQMGWRLTGDTHENQSNRDLLVAICSEDLVNHSGEPQYKSANTDVLGWIVERVSGRPLRELYVELVEAAGLENTFYMSCDRDGIPNLSGGICMTARDLARYGLIFVRDGKGIAGETIGSPAFTAAARRQTGPRYPVPASHISYGNQLRTNGRWIGHGGWGGQFLFIDQESETVVAFFSVLENESAADWDYQRATIEMCEHIAHLGSRDG